MSQSITGPALSPKQMAAHGWTRIDPRPWSKLNARWRHATGWMLEHCGHPTALWPWDLHDPSGRQIRTGVRQGLPPTYGIAWPDLRTAVEWVAAEIARAA